ncbi:Serine aminopeptidase, S33 [Reichenbachiella faecimaris]|uniref:Serine aminopeptidase, S33 n=1 Tax=Reichenbachiella faecimaris TaxID=692418 RepID=A0A1W2G6C2_REIFA|nr:alpha/beta hydrolase [Reichenbachiella faecimaris]SMD31898.1 Serine aminopeptidase, S33 [Reichenbachiella faecimaris]
MRLIVLLTIITFSTVLMALSPKRTYNHTPHDFHMTYEKLTIPSSGGAQLNAWYFPSDLGDQLMIISHDGVGNMGDYLERVKILVHYGFSVVIYDYRGFGQSSDFKINKFQYVYKEFYDDFDAVYNYCENRFHHELIAYGWGIGAGISVSRGYQKEDIAGIIADEPFVDFTALKAQFGKINAVMTLPDGIENNDFNALTVVQKTPGKNLRGILYLHGSKNFLYSSEDMDKLMNATSLDFKELYQFDVASRMDNFTINESDYAKQIYGFVLNL